MVAATLAAAAVLLLLLLLLQQQQQQEAAMHAKAAFGSGAHVTRVEKGEETDLDAYCR